MLPKGLPDDAVPFAAVNATDITTTTKQTIKAATAGKRLFVTQAHAYNKTTTEDTILALRHGTTDVAILHPTDIALNIQISDAPVVFDPPIVIPANTDLDGISVIANKGDCVIFVNGYIGT
jgi:hypothetical protein